MFTKKEMFALPKGTEVVFIGVDESEGGEAVELIPKGTIMTKAYHPDEMGDDCNSYCHFKYESETGLVQMPMLETEIAPLTKSMGV